MSLKKDTRIDDTGKSSWKTSPEDDNGGCHWNNTFENDTEGSHWRKSLTGRCNWRGKVTLEDDRIYVDADIPHNTGVGEGIVDRRNGKCC